MNKPGKWKESQGMQALIGYGKEKNLSIICMLIFEIVYINYTICNIFIRFVIQIFEVQWIQAQIWAFYVMNTNDFFSSFISR